MLYLNHKFECIGEGIARLAQLAERVALNHMVVGSIPTAGVGSCGLKLTINHHYDQFE